MIYGGTEMELFDCTYKHKYTLTSARGELPVPGTSALWRITLIVLLEPLLLLGALTKL